MTGRPILEPALTGPERRAAKTLGVTRRHMECMRLVASGFFNKEIGIALQISPITVKNHLCEVYFRTHTSNRADLTRLYIEHCGFPPGHPGQLDLYG